MAPLDMQSLTAYIEANIIAFHQKRLEKLSTLNLHDVLRRKNPYLFRAKNILTAHELVQSILNAYLSSQEETLFGNFLEDLAVFVAKEVYGGHKSAAEGIDLEIEKDGTVYIVAIKSGPNWGNSSQIARMRNNFKQATRRLRQNRGITAVVAVNGCCYGRDNRPDKGDYLKLCGQAFWEFISGDSNMYVSLIQPLGHRAREKHADFQREYTRILNRFTREFMDEFCTNDLIDWHKLLRFNSGKS